MKNSLFISYALGRIYSGILCGAMCVVYLTWLVQTLEQQGIAVSRIAETIAGLIVMVLFSSRMILNWAADRPYKLMIYHTVCMLIDIVIVFTCQSLPWMILGSLAFTSIGPTVFLQARAIMLNRVMASDELSLFKNRLDTLAIISSLAGSGLGMIIPVSLDAVGWLSLVYLILILHVNLWQIRELEKMPRLKLE